MNSFTKLEYIKIIQIIEKYCNTSIGKKQCNLLSPSFNFDNVSILLNESLEALNLLNMRGNVPIYNVVDIELYVKSLQSNQILSTTGLLSIARLLKIARELKDYYVVEQWNTVANSENNNLKLDIKYLDKYFSSLYYNKEIENEIFFKILDENTINDNASSKLASLRRNRRNLERSIKEKLLNILHSPTYSKYLMEPVITIRNNRYVIPVKEEYRTFIPGLIHDISSSGSTVYLEPTNVFETNNKIATIKIEEEQEIEKILERLSNLLYEYTPNLQINIETIAHLDLLFAKAKYAKDNNCVMPILNKEKTVNLIKAKHPLIDKDKVIPIDISLGNTYHTLIITGPNTGGKTVSLKTFGLLLLMAYSGILIPCNEQSSICVFSKIFVDIGDEQNIQESLSTFSSHILNIVNIINEFDENSLILVDELGSGTDPIEGANLAISILQYFAKRNALTICTTHYQELKEFALVNKRF